MEYFTTKIVDSPAAAKINLEKINKLLMVAKLPESLKEVKKVIVTIVAREPNDFEFDVWQRNGKIYFTIPLIYEEVIKGKEEEVTVQCGRLFDHYIKDLDIKA